MHPWQIHKFFFYLSLSLSLSPPEGSSYFFKGKEYWRVPSSDMEVEAGFPRLIGKDWLLCTEMQSDSPDAEPKSTETKGNVHQHPDHAENGYEVCSCTSDTASPLGARPSPSPVWLLPPLWTLSLAFRSELLWWPSPGQEESHQSRDSLVEGQWTLWQSKYKLEHFVHININCYVFAIILLLFISHAIWWSSKAPCNMGSTYIPYHIIILQYIM